MAIALVGALCIIILLPAFFPSYHTPGMPMDEGMTLVYPELVQRGAVLYRDFETAYGPANWWFLSAVYSVFGTNINVERTVGLFYRLVCLASIFGLLRRFGLIIAASCTLLAGSLLVMTGIVALSWWGAMTCALSAIALATHDGALWRYVAAGVLAGLAILFRVDLTPALCLAALSIFLKQNRRNQLLFAGPAAVTVIMPLLVLVCLAGSGTMINELFIIPVLRSGPARNLPFSGVDFHLQLLLAAHVLATVINVVAGIVALRAGENKRAGSALLVVALFTAGITYQPYHRLDYLHLLFTAFLSIGFLPLSLSILASASRVAAPRFAAALGAASAAILFLCMPSIRNGTVEAFARAMGVTPQTSFLIQRNDRSFPVASQESAMSIGQMLEKLDLLSQSGQSLFVGPADLRRTNYGDTFIYHLMPKLRPGSYFLEMNPFSANAPGSCLANDLRRADWLVLNRAWDNWPEPNRSRENGPDEPLQVVRQDFVMVEEFGSFQLFQHKHQ